MRTGKRVTTFHKVRPDLPSHAQPSRKGKGKAYINPGDARGHTDEVWALALSGDGRYLASGSKDRRIGIWDTTKNEWVKGFSGHKDFVSVCEQACLDLVYYSSTPYSLSLFVKARSNSIAVPLIGQ